MPRSGPALRRAADGGWEVEFRRPPVDRMEYRFELVRPGGDHELVLDPGNPLRAPGAFGERSVVEFPGYVAPEWLRQAPRPGQVRQLSLPSQALDDPQPVISWSSPGTEAGAPLPLLIALDGAEFAEFSGLLQMLEAEVASGALPPMRALLCHPTRRDDQYTASPELAEFLAHELLPGAAEAGVAAPEPRLRVGLGASLGGLALLHAQRSEARFFGGLCLQSSSFLHHGFTPGSFRFERIAAFVDGVLAAAAWPEPVPIAMTCGTVEPNLANNREMSEALTAQGYDAELHVVRDAHNWVAWRDAWSPHLIKLLETIWS